MHDYFKNPRVPSSMICMSGFHKWVDIKLQKGSWKRLLTGKRGCVRCGVVQVRRSTMVAGGGKWNHWGYLHPEEFDKTIEDIVSIRQKEIENNKPLSDLYKKRSIEEKPKDREWVLVILSEVYSSYRRFDVAKFCFDKGNWYGSDEYAIPEENIEGWIPIEHFLEKESCNG